MNDQLLRQFITSIISPTEAEWNDFRHRLTEVHFRKGEKLVLRGKPCTALFFVQEGIARHYFLDNKKQEITTWFSQPGTLATDYGAFTMRMTAQFGVQAVTDIQAWKITFTHLQELYDQYKNWERLGRLINQYYLYWLIERNNAMYIKTARQRYDEFCDQQGHLFNYVPLKHLATYLGITIETLSRLRSGAY